MKVEKMNEFSLLKYPSSTPKSGAETSLEKITKSAGVGSIKAIAIEK
jgi:hypothetical protein